MIQLSHILSISPLKGNGILHKAKRVSDFFYRWDSNPRYTRKRSTVSQPTKLRGLECEGYIIFNDVVLRSTVKQLTEQRINCGYGIGKFSVPSFVLQC